MKSKCPSCGGRKTVVYLEGKKEVVRDCLRCGGSGEVEVKKVKPSEADEYKLGLEHADRLWRDVIVSRIQELETDAMNELHATDKSEKCMFAVEVLRGLLDDEKKEEVV